MSTSSVPLVDDELDLELVELDRSLLDAVPLLSLLSRAAARGVAGLSEGDVGAETSRESLTSASDATARAGLGAAASGVSGLAKSSSSSWSGGDPTAGLSFPGVTRAASGAGASTSSGFPGFSASNQVGAGSSVLATGSPGAGTSGSSSTLSSGSWGSGASGISGATAPTGSARPTGSSSASLANAAVNQDSIASPGSSSSGLRVEAAARSWPGMYAGMDAGSTTRADLLIVFVARDERPLGGLAGLVDWRSAGRLSAVLRSHFFEGDVGEQLLVPLRANIAASRLVAIGLGMPGIGAAAPGTAADPVEQGRAAGEAAAACALGLRARTVLVGLPARLAHRLTAEGILLGWAEAMRAVKRGEDVVARFEQIRRGPSIDPARDALARVGVEASSGGGGDPEHRATPPAAAMAPSSEQTPADSASAGLQSNSTAPDAVAAKDSQVVSKKGKKRGKDQAGKSRSKGKLRGVAPAPATASGEASAGDAGLEIGGHEGTRLAVPAPGGVADKPTFASASAATTGRANQHFGELASDPERPASRATSSEAAPDPSPDASLDPGSSGAFIAQRLRTGAHVTFDPGGSPAGPHRVLTGDSGADSRIVSGEALPDDELDGFGSGPHLGPPEPPLAVFACDGGQISRLRRVLAGPPRAAGV